MQRADIITSGTTTSTSLWKSLTDVINAIEENNNVSTDIYHSYLIDDKLRDLRRSLSDYDNIAPTKFIEQISLDDNWTNNISQIRILMLINEITDSIISMVDDDKEINKYISMVQQILGKEDILL